MHFSKIYIQDNFVPNVVEDPFRRKVIGVEITVNEGESMGEAKCEAEKFIKEYIQANIVYPDHDHIEEQIIPVEKNTSASLESLILNCTELEGENGLLSYKTIAAMNPKLKEAYDLTFKFLSNE
jgi:hypothetical protein